MPTNRYKCSKCSNEWSFIGPLKDRVCPSCQESNKPLLPSDIASPSVMETVDPEFGIKWRENMKEITEKRNKEHTKKIGKELAREHKEDPSKFGITEDDAKII